MFESGGINFEQAVTIILWLAGLAVVIVIGIYVVGLARRSMRDDGVSTNELLTSFRDLHDQGELEDDEFRTIKGKLGERLRAELKRDEENG